MALTRTSASGSHGRVREWNLVHMRKTILIFTQTLVGREFYVWCCCQGTTSTPFQSVHRPYVESEDKTICSIEIFLRSGLFFHLLHGCLSIPKIYTKPHPISFLPTQHLPVSHTKPRINVLTPLQPPFTDLLQLFLRAGTLFQCCCGCRG